MPTIKDRVRVIINTVPRLAAATFGNEWPEHPHSQHTLLNADDHLQYMLCSAGVDRPFTEDVYFEEDVRLVAESSMMFDDHWRATHASGGGDWSLLGINLSDSPAEWQDFYDAFGEVSLLAAMTYAASGNTLDGAYDFGGAGAGRAIDVDSGAVTMTNGLGDNSAILQIGQADTTNNPNALEITNAGSGNSIHLTGSVLQTIWSDGVLLLGADSSLWFDDVNRSGSSWATASGISLSASSSEWDAMEVLGGGEVSIFALISAASLAAAQPDGQIVYGAGGGTSISSEAAFKYDSTNNYLNLYDTGGTDYIRIYHDGTYARITTGGESLALGAETSNRSVTAAGDLVARKAEFNNAVYFDQTAACMDNVSLLFGDSGDATWKWGATSQTYDALMFGISGSYNVLFVNNTYINSDFSVANSNDPTFFFFSDANPAVDNTQYGSIGHTGAHFRVYSATGPVFIPSNATATALYLDNETITNTSEVLSIYNQATSAGHKDIYLYGDAGDGNLVRGHKIWSDESISLGTDDTITGTTVENYLTHMYDWTNQVTVVETRSMLGVNIDSGTTEAYFRVSGYVSTIGGADSATATMFSQAQATVWSDEAAVLIDAYTTATVLSRTSSVKLDSWVGSIQFDDGNRTGSTWAQAYMLLSDDTADWDEFDAAFGEVSLMGAIVQAAASSGIAEPAGQIVYGNDTGVDSDAGLKWSDTYDMMTVTNNVNQTYWYSANASAIYMTGTATQGQVISSDKNTTIGVYDPSTASGDFNLDLIVKTGGAGTHATATLQALAEGADAEAHPAALAQVYAYSAAYTATAELYANTESTSDAVLARMRALDGTNESLFELLRTGGVGSLELTLVNYFELNECELRGIQNTSYTPYAITVTTNDFTIDPDNGTEQTVAIAANSTFDVAVPSNGASKTNVAIRNTDTSAHTVSVVGTWTGTIQWIGDTTDGFTVPANDGTSNGVLELVVKYDASTGLQIGAVACTAEVFV